jgi:hypothetical protein
MKSWLRHLRWREFQLVAMVLANLFVIAGHLGAGLQQAGQETGGWRRIDTQAVLTRMRAGELSGREAEWYRSLESH